MFALGVWLIGVAAVGAWTGPVGVLLVEALAGGGGSLALAGYLGRAKAGMSAGEWDLDPVIHAATG